ncbi:MAG: DUF2784 domain-containing protein [Pirellulales bacterium]
MYGLLADIVVVVHFVYVAFVVVGQLLILGGAALRWKWIRNFWFRVVHLAAILVVAMQAVLGMVCPLTTWENKLRRLAGQTVEEGSFVARWVHSVLFFELPPQFFTMAYLVFALLVLGTLLWIPPRRVPGVIGGTRQKGAG